MEFECGGGSTMVFRSLCLAVPLYARDGRMSSKPRRTARIRASRVLAMASGRFSGFYVGCRVPSKLLRHYAFCTVVLCVAGREDFSVAVAGPQRRRAALRFRVFCVTPGSMA